MHCFVHLNHLEKFTSIQNFNFTLTQFALTVLATFRECFDSKISVHYITLNWKQFSAIIFSEN